MSQELVLKTLQVVLKIAEKLSKYTETKLDDNAIAFAQKAISEPWVVELFTQLVEIFKDKKVTKDELIAAFMAILLKESL